VRVLKYSGVVVLFVVFGLVKINNSYIVRYDVNGLGRTANTPTKKSARGFYMIEMDILVFRS
jgi:hypothetical protein